MPLPSLAQFLNQYSFALMALAAWLVLALFVLRREGGWRSLRSWALLAIAAAALGSVWLGLRREAAPDRTTELTAADFQAALGGGQAVLIEYYSDY